MTSAGEKGTSTSNVTVQSRDEFDDAGGVVVGAGVVEEDVVGAGVVEEDVVGAGVGVCISELFEGMVLFSCSTTFTYGALIDARMFSNTSSKSVDFIRGFDPCECQCPCVVMNDVRV